jgi:hypothetical protein
MNQIPRDDAEDVVDISDRITNLILEELHELPINIGGPSITLAVFNVINSIKGDTSLETVMSMFLSSLADLTINEISIKKNESNKH